MSRMQSFRFTLGLVAAAMIPTCAFDGMDTSHEDVESAVEATEALTEYDEFKLDFSNVDFDVYVYVSQQLDDGEQVYLRSSFFMPARGSTPSHRAPLRSAP